MIKPKENDLKQLENIITEEIAENSLYGVSWFLIKNDTKYRENDVESYLRLRESLTESGIETTDVFRVLEAANGYCFDISMNTILQVTSHIISEANKNVEKEEDKISFDKNIINKKYEDKRNLEFKRLSKKIEKALKDGKNELDIALFSDNELGKINVNCIDENNNKVKISLDAFKLKHWDIVKLNSDYLSRRGIRVIEVEIFNILPGNHGVKYRLKFKKI